MGKTEWYNCEFCGSPSKYVEPTSMFGCYCEDCLRLVIAETEEALNKLLAEKGIDLNEI